MTMVRDVMDKKVIAVSKSMDVRHICRLLAKHQLTGVPVLDEKKQLVGYISERDIISAVPRARFFDRTAKELMVRRVKTIGPDEPITSASKIFLVKEYRKLPVVKGGKVVGMLSRKNVIRHMMSHYY